MCDILYVMYCADPTLARYNTYGSDGKHAGCKMQTMHGSVYDYIYARLCMEGQNVLVELLHGLQEGTAGQWFCFSRNIGQVTLKIINFHYLLKKWSGSKCAIFFGNFENRSTESCRNVHLYLTQSEAFFKNKLFLCTDTLIQQTCLSIIITNNFRDDLTEISAAKASLRTNILMSFK